MITADCSFSVPSACNSRTRGHWCTWVSTDCASHQCASSQNNAAAPFSSDARCFSTFAESPSTISTFFDFAKRSRSFWAYAGASSTEITRLNNPSTLATVSPSKPPDSKKISLRKASRSVRARFKSSEKEIAPMFIYFLSSIFSSRRANRSCNAVIAAAVRLRMPSPAIG